MFNPSLNSAAKSSINKKAIADITKWVTEAVSERNVFAVDQFQVMVTEIQCNEPDCVPIETLVIVVLMDLADETPSSTKGAQKWANKIMMPVAEVTRADVDELMIEMFPSANDGIDKIGEGKARIKLFDSELTALINKYQTPDTTEEATSCKLLFIETLQTQVDILRRDITKAEIPVPLAAVPLLEPARVVTTVIMKPNGTKSPSVGPDGAPSSLFNTTPTTTISNSSSALASDSASASAPAPALGTSSSSNDEGNASQPPLPPPTAVKMTSTSTSTATAKAPTPVITYSQPIPAAGATIAPRHKKGGTRPRGCPCCDPDNLDNIIDTMMFSHYPQT